VAAVFAAKRMGRVVLGVAMLAALALASTAKSGLISTGPASYCSPTATQAFASWGDQNAYTFLPNGGFENGATSWALSGGAKVVPGNEPFHLNGRSDSHSLLLPAGSSAYSATMCFALGDWHLRFLMRNVGSQTGSLRVTVIVPSLLGGLLTVLDGGTVSANGT